MKVIVPVPVKRYDMPVIDVEIVDVAPQFAAFATFGISRNIDAIDGYRITNIETGACIGATHRLTRAECIEAARKYLAAKTVRQMRAAIKKFGKSSGFDAPTDGKP